MKPGTRQRRYIKILHEQFPPCYFAAASFGTSIIFQRRGKQKGSEVLHEAKPINTVIIVGEGIRDLVSVRKPKMWVADHGKLLLFLLAELSVVEPANTPTIPP